MALYIPAESERWASSSATRAEADTHTATMFKYLILALCVLAAAFAAEESAAKEKRGLAYATGLGYSPYAYSGLYSGYSGLYNGYSAYGVPAYASNYYGYSGLGYNGLGYAAAPIAYGYQGIY